MNKLDRRLFLAGTAAGTAALVVPAVALAKNNNRYTVACMHDFLLSSHAKAEKDKWDKIIELSKAEGTEELEIIIAKPSDKVKLKRENIDLDSFHTVPVDMYLIHAEGIIIFEEDTELNFDADGDGVFDSIKTVITYNTIKPFRK